MSGVSPIHVWWLAIRPKTLWASVAPVVIGGAMATAVGPLHAPLFIVTLLVALSIQIGTNFSNDYSDFKKGADTDDRQGPLRVTQAGLVSPNQMMLATILVFGGSILCCAYLVYHSGWAMAVIGVISVIAGVLYTAGPYPLGYLGLGDVLVIVFFGPVAVGGTYFIQTGTVTATVLLSGLAPGLLATAILAVNNLRDLDGDRAVGKRTHRPGAARGRRAAVHPRYQPCAQAGRRPNRTVRHLPDAGGIGGPRALQRFPRFRANPRPAASGTVQYPLRVVQGRRGVCRRTVRRVVAGTG